MKVYVFQDTPCLMRWKLQGPRIPLGQFTFPVPTGCIMNWVQPWSCFPQDILFSGEVVCVVRRELGRKRDFLLGRSCSEPEEWKDALL